MPLGDTMVRELAHPALMERPIIRQWIYIAKMTVPDGTEDGVFRAIQDSCLRNNPIFELSGVLLGQGNEVVQVLEGTPADVELMATRIKADTRIDSLQVVLDVIVKEREFPDWSMLTFRPRANEWYSEARTDELSLSLDLPSFLPGGSGFSRPPSFFGSSNTNRVRGLLSMVRDASRKVRYRFLPVLFPTMQSPGFQTTSDPTGTDSVVTIGTSDHRVVASEFNLSVALTSPGSNPREHPNLVPASSLEEPGVCFVAFSLEAAASGEISEVSHFKLPCQRFTLALIDRLSLSWPDQFICGLVTVPDEKPVPLGEMLKPEQMYALFP